MNQYQVELAYRVMDAWAASSYRFDCFTARAIADLYYAPKHFSKRTEDDIRASLTHIRGRIEDTPRSGTRAGGMTALISEKGYYLLTHNVIPGTEEEARRYLPFGRGNKTFAIYLTHKAGDPIPDAFKQWNGNTGRGKIDVLWEGIGRAVEDGDLAPERAIEMVLLAKPHPSPKLLAALPGLRPAMIAALQEGV